jgi:hypothetical protein
MRIWRRTCGLQILAGLLTISACVNAYGICCRGWFIEICVFMKVLFGLDQTTYLVDRFQSDPLRFISRNLSCEHLHEHNGNL